MDELNGITPCDPETRSELEEKIVRALINLAKNHLDSWRHVEWYGYGGRDGWTSRPLYYVKTRTLTIAMEYRSFVGLVQLDFLLEPTPNHKIGKRIIFMDSRAVSAKTEKLMLQLGRKFERWSQEKGKLHLHRKLKKEEIYQHTELILTDPLPSKQMPDQISTDRADRLRYILESITP